MLDKKNLAQTRVSGFIEKKSSTCIGLKLTYNEKDSKIKEILMTHKSKLIKGFTQKYNVDRLMYYEAWPDIVAAIEREKQIKGWSRKKKNDLVDTLNPGWQDLYESLF